MDKTKRKELINAYKSKPAVGGIYCVECLGNGQKWIKPSFDIESSRSRFLYSIKINACPEPSMQRAFLEFGATSFSFTCLEELKKGETQTDREFEDDIKTLYEMWLEKNESK